MPNFNRGDVLNLTLDYDDVVTINGNASVKITPLGGTTSYTNITGIQTLGPYKTTSTALVITCDTAGSYSTANDPSVDSRARINPNKTGIIDNDTGADIPLGGGSSGITTGRTITASTTATLTDANTLITFSHATVAGVISIDKDANIAWPLLAVIGNYQKLAAACTFATVGGSGVNIRGTPSGLLNAIQHVGTDEWVYL